VKPGDLVEVGMLGLQGHEELIVGVLLEDCPPENHTNGMHLIWVLHAGFTKWWPASYVRKVDEVRD
jgi:hypothetical protein